MTFLGRVTMKITISVIKADVGSISETKVDHIYESNFEKVILTVQITIKYENNLETDKLKTITNWKLLEILTLIVTIGIFILEFIAMTT
jgi:hypothetical protein